MKRWLKVILVLVVITGVIGIWWSCKAGLICKSGLKQEEAAGEVKQEEVKELKFGVMADIHDDIKHLERALVIAKENQLGLVIVAGDLTKVGKREELVAVKKVLDDSGLKYFVIPGNHDKNIITFREIFGDNYQSFKIEGTKFILVDNSSWRGLGAEQGWWLEREVGECQKIICLVVMHMPLNNGFSEHIMGEDNEVVAKEAQELIKLFRDNGVKEIMAGHLHYASSYELDGVRTNLVGAVNGFQFSEFGISNGEVRREVHDLGN